MSKKHWKKHKKKCKKVLKKKKNWHGGGFYGSLVDGDLDAVKKEIEEKGSQVVHCVERKSGKFRGKYAPLTVAAQNGHPDVVKVLIEN